MTPPDDKIRSILQEERRFEPPASFAAAAQLSAAELAQLTAAAEADPPGYWAQLARRELVWHQPFTRSLDDSAAPNFTWFADGRLNVAWNCLDVHLRERGHRTALIFEGEPGDSRRLSYQELHAEVCRAANGLKSLGVHKGDRVVIYLPLVPEANIAMYACARIGAVHSVVFGGFSALSLRERIEDAGARVLITADGGYRAGHVVELKAAADEALAGCPTIERVVVVRRTGRDVPIATGRDLWWHDLLTGQSPVCEPEWVEAEHPLFLLYTSGSTGRPKGIQHSSAGYLLGAKVTSRWILDVRPDDIYWCTADVGWVTGHSYVVYGPLAHGAAVVLYEGAPTWPDGGRWWRICQTHGVTILYTAPTAIRALMRLGDAIPQSHDLSKLRLLGSVGEPINPEAWMWYHNVIGGGHCPIVDTWWQTETGAFMIAPVPGVTATKPGSCTFPLPGIEADIVDENGDSVTRPDAGGYLVIRRPWPWMLRTIWRDNARYLETYWEKFDHRFYVAGDGAHRDADGYFWIMGRIDDVLKVSGHRLGTMEVESALVAHARVAEAAVVGRPHEIKGESIFAYVVLRGPRPQGSAAAALARELREFVGTQLGPIAKPDDIRFTEVLPKTRSGKIMRRLLRAVARGEEITQDVSTLENPAILAQLRGEEPPAGAAKPPPAKKRQAAAQPNAARTNRAARPSRAGKKAAAKPSPPKNKRKTAALKPNTTGKKGAGKGKTARQPSAGRLANSTASTAVARPAAKQRVAGSRAVARKRVAAATRAVRK